VKASIPLERDGPDPRRKYLEEGGIKETAGVTMTLLDTERDS
jgi:hypothetical protein